MTFEAVLAYLLPVVAPVAVILMKDVGKQAVL